MPSLADNIGRPGFTVSPWFDTFSEIKMDVVKRAEKSGPDSRFQKIPSQTKQEMFLKKSLTWRLSVSLRWPLQCPVEFRQWGTCWFSSSKPAAGEPELNTWRHLNTWRTTQVFLLSYFPLDTKTSAWRLAEGSALTSLCSFTLGVCVCERECPCARVCARM